VHFSVFVELTHSFCGDSKGSTGYIEGIFGSDSWVVFADDHGVFPGAVGDLGWCKGAIICPDQQFQETLAMRGEAAFGGAEHAVGLIIGDSEDVDEFFREVRADIFGVWNHDS
jgi:hypothetical protein